MHRSALVCVCVRVCGCSAALLRVQTLSSVQQLVDIEPSPVSAMRMTLAQVVPVPASVPIFISNHPSSRMNVLLSVCSADSLEYVHTANDKPSIYTIRTGKKKSKAVCYRSLNVM